MAVMPTVIVVHVTCAICQQEVPINLHTRVETHRDHLQLQGTLIAKPDLADLYVHAWSHTTDTP